MADDTDGKNGGHRPDQRAVALEYKPDSADSAPTVIAAGQGFLAERIIAEAQAAGVTIHQDADLVEILAATEVGEEIPVEAFVAVAEILRYVYALNGGAPPLLRTGSKGGTPS